MVFEILGVNFLEIIKRYDYKGVPLPLVRRLAKQCLIGLDYMHRMCQMIHTDFKPENVVICLRDEEITEIQKTGQLTTTKMGKNEHIKNMNMKVAGTLGHLKVAKNKNKKNEDNITDISMDSKTAGNTVWDSKLFEGLTAKQKKNLRKKLQRQRKKKEKLENSQIQSSNLSSADNGSENDLSDVQINEQEIGEIDINIGNSGKKGEEVKDEEDGQSN